MWMRDVLQTKRTEWQVILGYTENDKNNLYVLAYLHPAVMVSWVYTRYVGTYGLDGCMTTREMKLMRTGVLWNVPF